MSAPEVLTSAGRVRGIELPHGAAFLGVPYAAPAVGADRFKPARAHDGWDGIRDATTHGPTALQSAYPPPIDALLPSSVTPGDDYLNVAVWTPDPGAQGLPVIVWIHGGAFVRGANSIPTYDGSGFARDGVVFVGINYRLGVPGFPITADAPTSLAIRDQIHALKWVQDNIAAFGGDPDNVTIMGESAGGMSVATLLATPAARGLFKRAIIQSGGGVSAGAPEDLSTFTKAVAERLGIEPTAASLGSVNPDQLLAAQDAIGLELAMDPRPERWGASLIRGGFGIMPVFPAIDGELLTDLPERLIAQGSSDQVPLLIGTNADEFNLWSVGLGLSAAITSDNLHALLGRYGLPPSLVDGYLARRPGMSPGDVFSAIITDLMFREPSIRIAAARASRSSSAGAAPTYMYEFAWPSPEHNIGAAHALELAFVFDTLGSARSGLVGPTAPQDLATTMHNAWVRFATDGTPGWESYTDADRVTRRFATDGPEQVADPRRDDRIEWTALA